MIPTKIILSSNQRILEIAIDRYSLEKVNTKNDLNIYEANIKNEDEIEKIVFVKVEKNIDLIFSYIEENYIYEQIINIDEAKIFLNFELKSWDVVIPNTFTGLQDENKAFFVDSVVWENYDLVKFWLILNGICLSVWNKKVDDLEELKEDFYADIIDVNSYDLIEKNTSLKNDSVFSAIKIVVWDEEDFLDEYYINALNVFDLIY